MKHISASSASVSNRDLLRLVAVGLGIVGALALTTPGVAADQIALNLNENPFGPSPRAIEAIHGELSRVARYTGAEAETLARAAARKEDVPVEQIVLGEVLEPLGQQLALQAPGPSEFVYSVPGYTALVDAAAPFGGTGVPVPLNERLENDLPAIRRAVNSRTRAVFLVNPHNSSGVVSAKDAFRSSVHEVAKSTLVIVDEAYLEYTDDFASRTVVDLVRAGDNVVVFRTFSKAYGLAGLPLGYAVVPRPLGQQLRKAGVGQPRSLDRLAVAAATAALADQDFVQGVRVKVTEERAAWNALFDRLKIEHADAAGNFVFFKTGRPHAEFAAALKAHGIDIGRSFPPMDTWARISIGWPEENRRARDAVEAVFTN